MYSSTQPLKFSPVVSDRLFYGHWRYCVKFYLTEVTVLRNTLDPGEINQALTEREEWRRNMRNRFPGWVQIGRNISITLDIRANICSLANFLRKQQNYKLVISVDYAWIYTNDVAVVRDVCNFEFLTALKLSEAVITRTPGVVTLRNSPHRWRSYFRSVKLTPEEKDQLHKFITAQEIRISPAFQKWLESHFLRTQDYYFVDYDSESWLTMLSLVRPGMIRKTLPIQTK